MFVHLHLHTEYSLLDGACRIERLLDTAKARGDKAVAITDHGVMYGAVDFYKVAKKRGIKPIIGCEVYVAQRSRFDRTRELDGENRHLVLLCENNTGYQNLIQLVSCAWTEGFYRKPRVDLELLQKYHEGLIALSACLAGEIPRALSANDYPRAKEAAQRYASIFGNEHFYLELQDHGLPEQKRVNPQLIRLSQETGIPLVVTNDCHYIEQEDSEMHHVLLCIQTNHTLDEEGGLNFGSKEFYYKTEEQMRALFPEHPEAADNTAKIAERCCVEFEFGKTKLPRFDTPNGQENTAYFREKCFAGLHAHYGENPSKRIVRRLEYELDTIQKMGYVNYYLIVHDFVRHAKEVGIPVGPGRGSGAGSLAAYCIGITGIDPLQYDLLFERFLNPERVSMPDFDIDFADDRRSEMIDYVVEKYGADHVAQIVTFGTMAARGSVRDVGRVMGLPYAFVDRVAKLIPTAPGQNMTLEKALEASRELKQRYEEDPQVKALIDMARKLEGMPRNTSTHAAGVVITDKPVANYVPLAKNGDATVCQYTMTTLEELGLLKMDFLGLRNLSVIHDAEEMIRREKPDFRISKVPLDVAEVYAQFTAGNTEGIFQFESAGMRSMMMQLHPEKLEDLIAANSLYRPGPMEFIPKYIQNRQHPEGITYAHPLLEPILKVTYGCIVYQEQVMQIFRSLAGYSLGRADIVRRAMSKKKHDVMQREKEIFIHGLQRADGTWEVPGCLQNGVDEQTALQIYGEMESFASYAFNKSHAAAYSYLAYQTAYLKCFYPQQYLAALLTSVLDSTGKLSQYIAECGRLHIRVLGPEINSSAAAFTVVGKDIRFGLLAVRNLGRGLIDAVLQERERSGPYRSFYDFCKRTFDKTNRRSLESFVKCGALDGLGSNRREMMTAIPLVLDTLSNDKRRNLEGQIGFFDQPEETDGAQEVFQIPKMEDYSVSDRLAMEKEVTGLFLSGNPLAAYEDLYHKIGAVKIGTVLESFETEAGGRWKDGDRLCLLGIVSGIKTKVTKNNSTMAFVTLEDACGSMELLVFPQVLARVSPLLEEGHVLCVTGRLSIREDEDPKLLCEEIRSAEEASAVPREQPAAPAAQLSGKHVKPGLYLKVKSREDPAYLRAKKYLAVFDGRTQLYVVFTQEKTMFRAPASRGVDVNEVLLRELCRVLGNTNVAYVQ
ncbi:MULTISPECIES: DNA polymerase III subunit alpha [Caproicibacterium]|uniref:DNA polymerase III subunit alpha n=1 Tax=Caproicibacterium argilliputei TaxID=3030016 RepID=A0AA97D6V9_9FIRM|nr:DNA polymerase III subunit alpha [Caproicibacterium argilliputei]WOC31429.1 DNA polymerase III subunit alpha [Caproicibacterium argilliputei]